MAPRVVSVENVSKMYRLGEIGTGSFYGELKRWWNSQSRLPDPSKGINKPDQEASDKDILWALKDLSFTVQQGETIGIIGNNGAGKSTLLKILSHLTAPTQGVVKVRGRIASLLEVGTGFHPELTGRENIFLNSAILGMSRRDTERKFDEIVDFSGVENFIDTPVKHYSSGMYVRLAFAVAAHLDSDILVLDEVLAVGDAEFQKKCMEKMADVALNSRTILFVSHNMDSVSRLCKRSIWIDHGILKLDGDTQDVLMHYLGKANADTSGMKVWEAGFANKGVNELKILSVTILNAQDEITTHLPTHRPFTVEVKYRVNESLSSCRVGILLSASNGTYILDTHDNDYDDSLGFREPGVYIARCEIPANLLKAGNYYLALNAGIPYVENFAWIENVMVLRLDDSETENNRFADRFGFISPTKFQWECKMVEHD